MTSRERVLEAIAHREPDRLPITFDAEKEVIAALMRHFNVQTRDDASGQPHLLEINLRYSGGIGYTRETGVNLPGIFAARRLGLPVPASVWRENIQVKAITTVVSVRGEELLR